MHKKKFIKPFVKLFATVYAAFSAQHGSAETPKEKKTGWSEYYEKVEELAIEPRDTLLKALSFFDREEKTEGYAIDLACGTGMDSLHLLKKGWDVWAMDQEEEAIEILSSRAEKEGLENYEGVTVNFQDMVLPENPLLINASFALPFCPPEHFRDLWEKIETSLIVGGRFSGHFFGVEDSWAKNGKVSIVTYNALLEMFSNFQLEYFEEVKEKGTVIVGGEKYWHLYKVVAKKLR